MTLRLLAAALLFLQAAPPSPDARPLVAGGSVRDTLAAGEQRVYRLEVPAGAAARVVITQDNIDVRYALRRQGSAPPEHTLDFVAGPQGEEQVVVPIGDVAATWLIFVSATLPRAPAGQVTLSFDASPADDPARAIADAHEQYKAADDIALVADGPAYQQAQRRYAETAAAAIDAGDLPLAAEATFQCARVHDSLGDTPGALEWQLRALDLFRRLGRVDRQSRVFNRLGDLSRKLGEIADAERYFDQALPLAREAQDAVSVADILNNSGLLLLSLGRFEEAIERLQSAIPLAQQVNSANVETALLNNLGEAYSSLGLHDQSIATFQRALVVVARLKLPRRTARTNYLLASAQFESGDREAAQRSLERSIALYEQSGDRNGLAQAIGLDGLMRHASGQPDEAVALFAQAQPLLREVRSPLAEARVLTAWAEVDVERGNAGAALERVDEALRLARTVANPGAEHKALYVRAHALQRAGRLDDAIGAIATAIEGVETTRTLMRRSELRTSYLTTVRRYFDLAIDVLNQKGEVAAAFEMSERARARTLLEGLAASAAKIEKGVDPALTKELRAVQSALNAKETYRTQLALAGSKSPRAATVDREIAELIERWNGLRAKIRAASPAYSALQMPEPTTVARVQASLVDESALVEYHLGATRSYVWVVDRNSITVAALPAVSAFEGLGRRYHELLSRETEALSVAEREALAGSIAVAGRQLSAVVWAPIEARVRGKRLLIAADGVLHYVPFAALPASNGQPLITRHEIAYAPSASVLESLRRNSRPIQPRALAAVFADPVFSKDDPRLTAARASVDAPASRAADAGYARLRFSRMEAEAIATASAGAFQALDFSAAKQAVVGRDLRKYRLLHFATHGSLDTQRPELSGLVFSLVDAKGAAVDGHLRLHEIYNLDLDADLVVLSACRTALGQEVHGEGLIGLTRGFMYAGASRVVSSVWNVDDRASARLMAAFYAAMLSKGHPPARALREAQLSLLNDPRWANPHYWAAFGLHGDWQ